MRYILLLLLSATSLFATDGTVSWSTFIRPLPCTINHNINPTTLVSAQYLTDTYYWAGPPVNDIVFSPRSVASGSYTVISEGSITSSNQPVSRVEWVLVQKISYDATCCQHESGFAGFEIRDVSEFTGGYLTNQIRNKTNIVYIGGYTRGSTDIHITLEHAVDTATMRVADINEDWPGYGLQCLPESRRLQQFFERQGTNKTLRIRGLVPEHTNTTTRLFTNAALSTNWIFAIPVSLNGNAEADVDMSSWNLPHDQFYFRLDTTNNP